MLPYIQSSIDWYLSKNACCIILMKEISLKQIYSPIHVVLRKTTFICKDCIFERFYKKTQGDNHVPIFLYTIF